MRCSGYYGTSALSILVTLLPINAGRENWTICRVRNGYLLSSRLIVSTTSLARISPYKPVMRTMLYYAAVYITD